MQPQQPNPVPGQPPVLPPPDYPPQGPAEPPLHPSHYDFIMNPAEPAKPGPAQLIPSGNSVVKKLVVGVIGLFVLLIIFVVGKGLLGGGSSVNLPVWLAVGQQQQELIHITTNVNGNTQQEASLSATDQNFSNTAQLAIGSEQSQLIAYLKTNGYKVTPKQLGLKVSTSVDTELSAAAAASTFDQTYRQVVQQQLTNYEQALSQAYKLTTGAKGRALLKSDYTGAQLLFQQLSTPSS